MSLKIEKKNEGTKDTVMLSGRLDTTTAPELDVFAEKELADTQELVLDFADLEYISSAGLRVLLKLQKVMNKKGSMKLIPLIKHSSYIFLHILWVYYTKNQYFVSSFIKFFITPITQMYDKDPFSQIPSPDWDTASVLHAPPLV